jgi:hypothetical protein
MEKEINMPARQVPRVMHVSTWQCTWLDWLVLSGVGLGQSSGYRASFFYGSRGLSLTPDYLRVRSVYLLCTFATMEKTFQNFLQQVGERLPVN